mmetsp:Transcript_12503/g.30408  ORF Transcript_12503/g.30408 Transcript_12503/m.30408 type:complete len:180 (-) Transcript_12503:570-1109(-)
MAGRRSVSRSEGSKKDTQTAKEKKKEKKKEGGIEGAREFLREKVFENLKWEFFVILMVMLDIGCVFSVTILDDIVGEPDKWEFGPDATLLYSTKRAEAYALGEMGEPPKEEEEAPGHEDEIKPEEVQYEQSVYGAEQRDKPQRAIEIDSREQQLRNSVAKTLKKVIVVTRERGTRRKTD